MSVRLRVVRAFTFGVCCCWIKFSHLCILYNMWWMNNNRLSISLTDGVSQSVSPRSHVSVYYYVCCIGVRVSALSAISRHCALLMSYHSYCFVVLFRCVPREKIGRCWGKFYILKEEKKEEKRTHTQNIRMLGSSNSSSSNGVSFSFFSVCVLYSTQCVKWVQCVILLHTAVEPSTTQYSVLFSSLRFVVIKQRKIGNG